LMDEEKKQVDSFEIKIRFNKKILKWLERAIFLIVIITLAIMVYTGPFCDVKCEKGLDEIASEPAIEEEEAEIEEEPDVEEEEEETIEPEPETDLSGDVTLTIGDLSLDEDKKRIEYIWITINNDKKLFTPMVQIYWYGSSSPDAVKSNVKYKYTFPSIIPMGRTNKKLDEEIDTKMKSDLTGRYLNLEEGAKKVYFKIELYNANDNSLLDTKTKTISVS